MNSPRLAALYEELADIERQLQDTTLSHSDQQRLDHVWEEVSQRIDDLEDMMSATTEEWRDAAEFLEEAEEDSHPMIQEPVRFAPSPPSRSVTLQSAMGRDGRVMTRVPGGRWTPASLPSFAPPPPIEIPVGVGPTGCPPPPRPGGVPICNCDSDGRCLYCEEEELERWNRMDDDRDGCAQCSGCAYCQGYGYDGSDEV